MLGVTEVNGCKYCNYFHTRQAMKEGISKDEIRAIEASIKVVMVGNIYGIAVDGLMRRFSGKNMKDSKLSYELGITLGSLFMFPAAVLQGLFYEKIQCVAKH